MSTITFVGWLKSELSRMSGGGPLRLKRLVNLAQIEIPRLAPLLLFYAIETDRVDHLLAAVDDEELGNEYREVLVLCKGRKFNALPDTIQNRLPWSYRKLIASWKAVRDKNSNRSHSKELRLNRTLALKEEKGVTNAQIYQTLGLNPGNVNAYLKHRDVSKVSLETATNIMKYLYAERNES
jgi:hypothetical protein